MQSYTLNHSFWVIALFVVLFVMSRIGQRTTVRVTTDPAKPRKRKLLN